MVDFVVAVTEDAAVSVAAVMGNLEGGSNTVMDRVAAVGNVGTDVAVGSDTMVLGTVAVTVSSVATTANLMSMYDVTTHVQSGMRSRVNSVDSTD